MSTYNLWLLTRGRVLTDPKDVQTVFRDSNNHGKGINNDAGWLMGQLLGSCLGLISGLQWQRVLAATGQEFTYKSAAASISRIRKITQHHIEGLHMHGNLCKGTIDPVKDLRMLFFWMVADKLYGSLTPALQSELSALIPLRESLFDRVIQGGITRFAWSRFLPTSTNQQLADFQRRWEQLNDAAYTACKDKKQSATIVSLYDAQHAGSITKEQALQTLDEMLFANLDVTIGGTSWNLMFLAADQEIQAQLRDEMQNEIDKGVISCSIAAGVSVPQSSTSQEQAPRDKYLLRSDTLLAASILESAQLKPLAAFSVPQAAPTARTVGGFVVPAGTNFVVDTQALNIRSTYWGVDSTEYRPSRHLGKKPPDVRYHYWRFGFGARLCLGRHFADLMIRVLVAYLIENYTLSLDVKSRWEKNPMTWITHPHTEIKCEKLA